MGHTITEKILARAAGRAEVSAGEEIDARPDYVLAYDWPGQTDVIFKEITTNFGVRKLKDPSRFALFIDHMTPAGSPKDAEFHEQTRASCAELGIEVFEHKGIGHHVASEVGYAVPGAFVVHFDGHVSQLGAMGTLAIGLRRSLIEAFVSETVTITVPHTTRVDFTGELPRGVMARDVFHHLVRLLGPGSCRFHVLEFGGPGLSQFSTDGLQAMTGLAMFIGAQTAIVNPEDDDRFAQSQRVARKQLGRITSDVDAAYSARHTVDLSSLEPIVVAPPSPANTRDLADCLGLQVHVGYIGSCVSGKLEDLRAAAMVLKGRKVKAGFTLNVVPTSQRILAQAAAEGLIDVLVDAGAFIGASTCDYCYGRMGVMKAQQRAVSTGTLNVPGRMGDVRSEVYICNAATIAASAIEGRIADPRKYLET